MHPKQDIQETFNITTSSILEYTQSPVNFYHILFRGYLQPALAILTTFTNILALCVFAMNKRSPTTFLLSAICVTDILTGLASIAHNILVYGIRQGDEIMPEGWCRIKFLMMIILRNIFHTSSTMSTVLLCVERHVCVSHPFAAKRWCSLKRVALFMILTFLFGAILHGHLLIFVECSSKIVIIREVLESICDCTHTGTIGDRITYYVLRIAYSHLIPCFLVTWLTSRLFLAIRRNKKTVSKYQVKSVCRQLSTTRDRMTHMSIAIALIFITTEVPLAVLYVLWAVEETTHWDFSAKTELNFKATLDVLIAFNCLCNFWIFCCMSANFRKTLMALLTCRKKRFTELAFAMHQSGSSTRSDGIVSLDR